MEPSTVALLSVLLYSAFEFYINWRQAIKLKDTALPAGIVKFERLWKIDAEEYKVNKQYSSEKMRVSNYQKLAALAFEIFFYYSGLFKSLYQYSQTFFPESTIGTIFVFLIFKQLIDLVFSLPFSYYLQFVVEEKFGFNKMTKALFVKDTAISFALELVISTVIFSGFVFIIDKTGVMMPIYASAFLTVIMLGLLIIWPNFIAPLFNKFEPLGQNQDQKEVDLRKRVEEISNRAKFPVTEIYKMDGSKRSAHSQAYFFGIFKNKRIVIYDTLIRDLENQQTEAVLCHEIGHWHHAHNIVMIVANLAYVQLLVYIISKFVYDPVFYKSFGFDQIDYFVGVSLSMLMFPIVSGVVGLILVYISRRNEYQADEYAIGFGHTDNLIEALVLIHKHNKADFDPDWLYSCAKRTHPTLLERIDNLNKKR